MSSCHVFPRTESVDLLTTIFCIEDTTAVMLMSMNVRVDYFPSEDAMRSYFGMAPRVKTEARLWSMAT